MNKHKFAVFDVDWTLHNSSIGVDFLVELANTGLLGDQTLDSKYKQWRQAENRGVYFREHFAPIYDSGINAIPRVEMEKIGNTLAKKIRDSIFDELQSEINVCRLEGLKLIMISQSPKIVVSPLAKLLDFEICIASDFIFDEQGTYIQPRHRNDDEKNKGTVLKKLIDEHGLSLAGSRAYGDSLDDLPMLEIVHHPVAVNPSEQLLEIALERRWRILRAHVR